MVKWVPEVEDIKRTISMHQNTEQIAVQKSRKILNFAISSIEKGTQTLHTFYTDLCTLAASI